MKSMVVVLGILVCASCVSPAQTPAVAYQRNPYDKARLEVEAAPDNRQQLWLIGTLGSFVALVGVTFLLYRTNRQRQTLNALLQGQQTNVQTLQTQLAAAGESLRTIQAQLIEKEKLASLGELTAGIAHEIQNPLNFVNNFAEVSIELADDLAGAVRTGNHQKAGLLVTDLQENMQQIAQSGRRASAIVQAMLEHARSGADKAQPTDLNALAEEFLRLAYYGQRAKNKDFACALQTSLAHELAPVNLVPQEIGRVLLNLYNNAFYAVQERARSRGLGAGEYQPQVSVSTQAENGKVELRVSDNGTGIPADIVPKIFQPFFTTKPAGQGTGLGLSLSYDIITNGHGGTITLDTQEGKGTTVSICLPAKLL
ncbi:hypothetical protein GCM10023187_23380 [Nibrella viscosa]|uniref:histidine kinase n=1 Tax=Nibrella viscosa TaxID=1084524 RepID=A0ABP8KEV3_9BACT